MFSWVHFNFDSLIIKLNIRSILFWKQFFLGRRYNYIHLDSGVVRNIRLIFFLLNVDSILVDFVKRWNALFVGLNSIQKFNCFKCPKHLPLSLTINEISPQQFLVSVSKIIFDIFSRPNEINLLILLFDTVSPFFWLISSRTHTFCVLKNIYGQRSYK